MGEAMGAFEEGNKEIMKESKIEILHKSRYIILYLGIRSFY